MPIYMDRNRRLSINKKRKAVINTEKNKSFICCLSFTNIFVLSFILEPQQNMKYPIGIQSFDQIREDGYVYVDKTGLIYNLVTTRQDLFLEPSTPFWQKPAGGNSLPVISRDAKICLPDWKSTDWKRTGMSILSSV